MLILTHLIWNAYETEDGLEPEYEDVQFWIDELIYLDKFVWK